MGGRVCEENRIEELLSYIVQHTRWYMTVKPFMQTVLVEAF